MDTLTTTRDDINYHRSIRQDNDVNGTSTDTNTAIERGNDKIAYFLRDTREDSWRNYVLRRIQYLVSQTQLLPQYRGLHQSS
ncbi:MAG: hypothetical protein WAM42_13045 [Candidatus Nitrosopolaris sp.]|jgi:hypothetical protein